MLAVYVSVSSTSALICSLLLSTGTIVIFAKIGNDHPSTWAGWLWLGGYLGSIVIGGILGAAAGILALLWMRNKNKRQGVESDSPSYGRQMFGQNE